MILNVIIEENEKVFVPDFESVFITSKGDYIETISSIDTLPNTTDVSTTRQSLILHNMKLVNYIVNEYRHTNVEYGDLMSVGIIGLIKAIDTYSEDNHAKLSTYAYTCIRNEILMYMRKSNKYKLESFIDDFKCIDDEGNEKIFSDIFRLERDTAYQDVIEDIDNTLIHIAMTMLDAKEREIIELRYGFLGRPYSQQEVADKLHMSQSYLSRVERRILDKLRKELINMGF